MGDFVLPYLLNGMIRVNTFFLQFCQALCALRGPHGLIARRADQSVLTLLADAAAAGGGQLR